MEASRAERAFHIPFDLDQFERRPKKYYGSFCKRLTDRLDWDESPLKVRMRGIDHWYLLDGLKSDDQLEALNSELNIRHELIDLRVDYKDMCEKNGGLEGCRFGLRSLVSTVDCLSSIMAANLMYNQSSRRANAVIHFCLSFYEDIHFRRIFRHIRNNICDSITFGADPIFPLIIQNYNRILQIALIRRRDLKFHRTPDPFLNYLSVALSGVGQVYLGEEDQIVHRNHAFTELNMPKIMCGIFRNNILGQHHDIQRKINP